MSEQELRTLIKLLEKDYKAGNIKDIDDFVKEAKINWDIIAD